MLYHGSAFGFALAFFLTLIAFNSTARVNSTGLSSREAKILCSYIPECAQQLKEEQEYRIKAKEERAQKLIVPHVKTPPIPEVKVFQERLEHVNILKR